MLNKVHAKTKNVILTRAKALNLERYSRDYLYTIMWQGTKLVRWERVLKGLYTRLFRKIRNNLKASYN